MFKRVIHFILHFILVFILHFILFDIYFCIFLSMKFTLKYKWCLSISSVPNNHIQKRPRISLCSLSGLSLPGRGHILDRCYHTDTRLSPLFLFLSFPGSPRPFSRALYASHTNHQQDKDCFYGVN